MSLSDCPKCWETPCICGHDYKDYSDRKLSAVAHAALGTASERYRFDETMTLAEIMNALNNMSVGGGK